MPSEFYDDNKFYKKSSVSFHFNFFNLQKIRNPGKTSLKNYQNLSLILQNWIQEKLEMEISI